jgi:hypothetical protein
MLDKWQESCKEASVSPSRHGDAFNIVEFLGEFLKRKLLPRGGVPARVQANTPGGVA